jgi:hypothetical protein
VSSAQVELDAQIDNRHDDPAQVDHALDELGRIGDLGDSVIAADFLHLEDVDAVFLCPQREGEVFTGGRRRRWFRGNP